MEKDIMPRWENELIDSITAILQENYSFASYEWAEYTSKVIFKEILKTYSQFDQIDKREGLTDIIVKFEEKINCAKKLLDDIKNERKDFFDNKLRDIVKMLREEGVDDTVISQWVVMFAKQYDDSLDISSNVLENYVGEIVNEVEDRIHIINKNKEE